MKNSQGFVLILTLVIVTVITAMVIEFVSGVHATSSNLKNWTELQRLSFIAKSGVTLAAKTVSEAKKIYSYTYPSVLEMPVEKPVEGFNGRLTIRIEDEEAKINLNALIMRNGKINMDVYRSFKRLLGILQLDEAIVDAIADWIDKDSEPALRDSEEGAKNNYMDSVDELLLIKGIDSSAYEKLSPYVTVYGVVDRLNININTASIPVIMSLNESITRDIAEKMDNARKAKPFEGTNDPNFNNIVGSLKPLFMGHVDVRSSNFRITSTAQEGKIKRIIEAVIAIPGDSMSPLYWKEM
jgi:general secretion pathway protein K